MTQISEFELRRSTQASAGRDGNGTQAPRRLNHLRSLESESIHILREAAAEFAHPVMLYSIGKDSSVMLRLAQKAFFPGKIPFPLLHIDTSYKFPEMIEFRDTYTKQIGAELIVHKNQAALDTGANPFLLGTQKCCGFLKTRALLDALAAGGFDAAALPVGRYEVLAEKNGFRTEVKIGISVVVGQRETVDIVLQVGDVRQTVQVESAPTLVAITTEDDSGLVGERQVKDLPLNGRSYDQLMTLNPGIVNYTSQRAGGIGTSNSVVGNMFSASGRRPQENLYLLNGVEFTSASEINNTLGGVSGQLLGVDAVREFSVVKDTYGAEYGKRPGAQVNIVTASGTNDLHGNVYEFLRNSALDARNFFDHGDIPPFRRNEFGGSLGGPIRKDKTFLFRNYAGFRQNLSLSDLTLVPDMMLSTPATQFLVP